MSKDPGAIGYGSPPESGQFKPGQSGNPSGRKKGASNFKSDLEAELREIVMFNDDGRECKVTKQRAIAKALIALAIGGDLRAISAIALFTQKAQSDASLDDQMSADELEIMRSHFHQNLKQIPHNQESEND
jgi:hypothetical protein